MSESWWERPFVALDTETSGTDIENDRIVTATVIRIDPVSGEKRPAEWLINPGVDIPAEATAVHGITTEHARENGMDPATAVKEIAAILADAWWAMQPVVAYNACFDLSLLDRELRRHGESAGLGDLGPVLDPFVIDKGLDKFRKGSRKLMDTARLYGVELSEEDAHASAADALAAARVMFWGLPKAHPRLLDMRLPELHSRQIEWYAAQQTSFREYLCRIRRSVKTEDEADQLEARIAGITTDWPVQAVAA